MASDKTSTGSQRATAPAIPEQSFRSAVYIGTAALMAVMCILIYGLINNR
jgi:hypothetical protein